MQEYELALAADEDLQAIARYTILKWGIDQARRYEALIAIHLAGIASGQVRTKVFLKTRTELHVSRVEHHYVFHLVRTSKCPLILAVFHENMDLMKRLRDRLDS